MPLSSSLKTRVCDLLACRYPILQAGMGGVARSELVTAVSQAGGFGFLGMVREPPDLIAREIAAVRAGTDRPFGVNLIPASTDPALFAAELETCLSHNVHAVCFFWDVDPAAIARAKQAGCVVCYQVGSVADAVAAERAGADIVIAQGVEAGGHVRGRVSSLVLLPQVARAVKVPVVGSGGFAGGDSLIAALALGGEGIHCGTVFLATAESFAHDYHKERVVQAASSQAVHTDLFAINWPPNSPVRVIANSLVEAAGTRLHGYQPGDFAREPVAEEDGRPIYRYSTDSPLRSTSGDLETLALFAGQIAGSIETIADAGTVIADIVRDAEAILRCLKYTQPNQ